jgi:hypothetical protein
MANADVDAHDGSLRTRFALFHPVSSGIWTAECREATLKRSIHRTIHVVLPFRRRASTRPNGTGLLRIAVGVAASVGLTGCLFSSNATSGGNAAAPTTTVSGSALSGPPGAPTVPETGAPTVPLAQAEAAQLQVAAPTTVALVNALAPITSLLSSAAIGLRTPEAASRNLWDSWQDKDRERAVLYASIDAVNSLFALAWTPETLDQGCRPSSKATMAASCLFIQGTVVKVLEVAGNDKLGYKVVRVATGQQPLPEASVLPNADPNAVLPTMVPYPFDTGVPTTDATGAPVTPTFGNPGPSAGLPAAGGASGAPGASTVRAKPRTAKKPKAGSPTVTTRARSAAGGGGNGGATPTQPAVVAAQPTEAPAVPPNTGVPAGAPVVNQVEG